MHCMAGRDVGKGDNLPPLVYGQVAAMSVSRRWRALVLSHPCGNSSSGGVVCVVNQRRSRQLLPKRNWPRMCSADSSRMMPITKFKITPDDNEGTRL